MVDAQTAIQRIRDASFKVRISPRERGDPFEWGTGFFISSDGYALTAFHNLPDAVVRGARRTITANYRGQEIELACLVQQSLPEENGDIALLKLESKGPHTALALGIAPELPGLQRRNQFWGGRPLLCFGFPFRGQGQVEVPISGSFSSIQPFEFRDTKVAGGWGPQILHTADWLRCLSDQPVDPLEGISGAAILDTDSGCVVAVEHRYIPRHNIFYGSEVKKLGAVWPELFNLAQVLPAPQTAAVPAASGSAAFSSSMPTPPAMIIGRGEVIEELRRRIRPVRQSGSVQGTRVAAIRGWPGIGKTTVIRALANDPETKAMFPDGILWGILGQEPDVTAIVRSWGRQMGATGLDQSADLGTLQGELIRLLSDKEVLIIVDDAWETPHVLALQVGGNGSSMLVTTRLGAVADAVVSRADDVFVLPAPSTGAGLELLSLLAPRVVETHRDGCAQLIGELEGLPLGLQVAGRMLHRESKLGMNVDDLLAELKQDAVLLGLNVPPDRQELLSSTSATVAALLAKTTRILPARLRENFAMLGAFAPKPATFDFDAIRAVWADDNPRESIGQLVDRGLLEPLPGTRRFHMHSLLVMHARSLCASEPPQLAEGAAAG